MVASGLAGRHNLIGNFNGGRQRNAELPRKDLADGERKQGIVGEASPNALSSLFDSNYRVV